MQGPSEEQDDRFTTVTTNAVFGAETRMSEHFRTVNPISTIDHLFGHEDRLKHIHHGYQL